MKLDPYLGAAGVYDSNVFAIKSRDQAIAQNGDATRGDTIGKAAAGANAAYLWSRQELNATVEGRRYEYAHFARLDHNEYLLAGALKWALGNLTDGTINARQELLLAPFEQLDNSQFAYSRARTENGTFNLAATPEWRVETGIGNSQTVAPLEDGPDFTLRQNSADFAVKYLGVDSLTAGLFLEYLKGNYFEPTGTTDFHQITTELTSKYVISGLSTIDAKLGYTARSGDSVPGFTGTLNYSRVLSGKTSANAQVYRRVTSYTAGAGSLVETGAGLGVIWLPTFKVTATLRYDWERTAFQNQDSSGTDVQPNRKDTLQSTSLIIDYKTFNWLLVEPFIKYQNRDSNIDLRNFSEYVIGLQLHGRFGGPGAILTGATPSNIPY